MNNYDLPEYLNGIPAQYGLKQPNVVGYQGFTLSLYGTLKVNSRLINPANWIIEGVVKKNLGAECVLLQIKPGNNLILSPEPLLGHYRLIIPATSTAEFIPGTYWVGIKGKQRTGTGNVIDSTELLDQQLFEIQLAANSPNPRLTSETTTVTTYDPETGIYTVTTTKTEPTLPPSVNIEAK